MQNDPVFVIAMGVSGCGKSTIGEGIAKGLNAAFKDGDELHPQSNIDRMSQGIALTDEDRWPWLDTIRDYASDHITNGQSIVVACSALKASYRQRLTANIPKAYFVFLKGSPELILERQSQRAGHFMPASLIDSQFATLESPENEANVATLNIENPIDEVIAHGVAILQSLTAGQ